MLVLAMVGGLLISCNSGIYNHPISSKGPVVDAVLQVDPTDEPMVTKIREKVLFAFDSYALDAEAKTIVKKVAALLDEYPDTLLALEGFTDKYGSAEYNQKLSENRANAVKNALVALGVDAESIVRVEGFGKTKLIPNLSNRENRRVLILSIDEE